MPAWFATSGVCAAGIGLLFGGPARLLLVASAVWGVSIVTAWTCTGFLPTIASIQLAPVAVEIVGWRYAFVNLVIGPAIGIVPMARLRQSLA